MTREHLLIVAYALIWAFAFGYLVWMGRRQSQLRREIELLRKAVEGSDSKVG